MSIFEIIELSSSEIETIKPLWELLCKHHEASSTHFKVRYQKMKFEDRIAGYLHKTSKKIDVAIIPDTKKAIGYCLSSVFSEDGELVGEIDSLFVLPEFRHIGVGNALMNRAIEWLNKQNVARKKIIVAEGNEQAFGFYARYGFYHQANVLLYK
jgi:diamine N-acetyltransferase